MAQKNAKIAKILIFTLYLVPFLALIWFIATLGVNHLHKDQWNLIKLFEKIYDGRATFSDFYAQHSEHRLLFPKFLFSSLAFATGWNVRYELGLNFFFGSITAISLCIISRTTAKLCASSNRLLFHSVNLSTCCLALSWVQHQNWLWGFQVPWFFICLSLVLSALILYKIALPTSGKLLVAAVLCTIASFSSAHGLFTWLALTPSVAALSKELKTKFYLLLAWLLLFLSCIGVYFYGYHNPNDQPSDNILTAIGFIQYFFVQIGASVLGQNLSLPVAITAGIITCLLFTTLTIYLLKGAEANQFLIASPWFSIGLFSIIFALANSYGRGEYGAGNALTVRYTTPSIFLAIASLQLLPIALERISQKSLRQKVSKAGVFIIAIFMTIHLNAYAFAFQDAKYGENGIAIRKRQALCAELVQYIETAAFPQCFQDTDAHTSVVLKLHKTELRSPITDISFIKNRPSLGSLSEWSSIPSSDASIDTQILNGKKVTTATGITFLPADQPYPRAILLSPLSADTFIGIFTLDKTNSSRLPLEVNWEVDLTDIDDLPLFKGSQQIEIYLYYPQTKQFILSGLASTPS
ncbi:MAG: hypothetical protein AB8B99_24620 [Phormidesmis sp.]